MTPTQLKKLIESDADALRLAKAGSDDACAVRVSEIAPKVLTSQLWSYRGLSAVLPLDVMARLVATVNLFVESGNDLSPLVDEMRHYLRSDGIDLSNPSTQFMLQSWADSALPLTPDDVSAIIDAVSVRPTVSPIEITNLGLFEPTGANEE